MKPRHSWAADPADLSWEVCNHCGLGKKSLGRNGMMFRRPETGATWQAATTPDCTGPKPDPAQGQLFG